MPPTCSHAIQNGECHVNFIRKMQCSFSWDWGPTFASSGIIRDMQLFIGNDVNIQHVLVYPTRLNQLDSPDDRPFHRWRLNVRVILDPVTVDRLSFRVKFLLNNVTLAPSSNDPIIINSQQSNRAETVIEFELITSKDHRLLPWFPNGFDYLESDPTYFAPNLHQLTVQLIDPDRPKRVISSKIIRIGLRELDLQQVALKNGYSFYFRVQKTPVYMRGTNYIPSTMSIGHIQLESARIRRLMIEAKSAQINMIRVWGGGIYDLDLLYELADEYGMPMILSLDFL